MNPDDLELVPSEDLIAELLRRTTFQGVIVHAADEAKSPDWEGERAFSVRHNANLSTEEAGRLLDVISRHIALFE